MIDLHSHILPGIDDGAPELEVSLQMARLAVEEGITVVACTPHIFPGVYDNDAIGIRAAIGELQAALDAAAIPLRLVVGADVHLHPDFLTNLRTGMVPTLADSQYVLIELPTHVPPPQLEHYLFSVLTAGYVPILTHPERLRWIETHHALIGRLVRGGLWVQITAGSLTGGFGRRAQYWAERLLGDGLVHLLATDSHNMRRRPPRLRQAHEIASASLGREEADNLVLVRPQAILDRQPPSRAPALPVVRAEPKRGFGFFRRRQPA